jgi:hypothetical protein
LLYKALTHSTDKITQTFGSLFQSDGRPVGQEDIQVVQCNQANNSCTVTVYAPSYALVFLRDDAFSQAESEPPMTFSTSMLTRTRNTATVNPSVLATSNGHYGGTFKDMLGRTSFGKSNGVSWALQEAMTLCYVAVAMPILFRVLVW